MSQAAQPPLACNAGAFPPAERVKYTTLQQGLLSARTDTRELPGGFAFSFAGDDRAWLGLAAFVSLERRCCPFLTFTLVREGEASTLQLTGPEGTKAFLQGELGLA